MRSARSSGTSRVAIVARRAAYGARAASSGAAARNASICGIIRSRWSSSSLTGAMRSSSVNSGIVDETQLLVAPERMFLAELRRHHELGHLDQLHSHSALGLRQPITF